MLRGRKTRGNCPTRVTGAGRACTHLLPAGGACTRLLPRILSTTVGRHRAGPGSTCCRQAEPARTCCRASYRRPLAAIDWSGQGLRGSAAQSALAWGRLRFASRSPRPPPKFVWQAVPAPACCRGFYRRPLAATGQGPVPPAAAGFIDEFGKHKLNFPNSASSNPTACAAGASPFRGGTVGAIKALLKGELSPNGG